MPSLLGILAVQDLDRYLPFLVSQAARVICIQSMYGAGQAKSTVFFFLKNITTFAPTDHQPQTPDDNNLVTKIDRESSVQ